MGRDTLRHRIKFLDLRARVGTAVLLSVWLLSPGFSATQSRAESISVRVATRPISPTPYSVTLPEKLGTIHAGKDRLLSFEVSGRIDSMRDEGERVQHGEGIASLDLRLEEVRSPPFSTR